MSFSALLKGFVPAGKRRAEESKLKPTTKEGTFNLNRETVARIAQRFLVLHIGQLVAVDENSIRAPRKPSTHGGGHSKTAKTADVATHPHWKVPVYAIVAEGREKRRAGCLFVDDVTSQVTRATPEGKAGKAHSTPQLLKTSSPKSKKANLANLAKSAPGVEALKLRIREEIAATEKSSTEAPEAEMVIETK